MQVQLYSKQLRAGFSPKKQTVPVMDSQQQGILISASAVPFCGEVEETTKTRQAVAFYSLFQNVSVLDFPGERIPRNRDDDDIYKLQMNNANDEGKSRMAHEQRSPCPSS